MKRRELLKALTVVPFVGPLLGLVRSEPGVPVEDKEQVVGDPPSVKNPKPYYRYAYVHPNRVHHYLWAGWEIVSQGPALSERDKAANIVLMRRPQWRIQ